MRVTNRMMVDGMMRNINNSLSRLDKKYEQLSTGKNFSSPSDNPVGVTQSMRLRTSIAETSQYRKNADDGVVWMEATDSALGEFGDVLQRLKELATAGANSTLPQESMKAMADEVHELRDHIYMLANSEQEGRFLFAGTLTLQSPFVKQADGTITYQGNDGDIGIDLGIGVKMNTNITGSRAFGNAFAQLSQLEQDLRSGNVDGVRTAIDTVGSITDNVLQLRAEMGAKVNRMEMNQDRLDNLKLNYEKLLSNVEDVDFAKAVMDLKLEESVQQAALSTGARIIQPTLVDFLK